MQDLGVRAVTISAYNSQAHGFIEHGNQTLARGLLTVTNGGQTPVEKVLPVVLWADRTTTKSTTGLTPAYVVFGYEPVLPVEVDVESWPYFGWKDRLSTEELLELRAKQFSLRKGSNR